MLKRINKFKSVQNLALPLLLLVFILFSGMSTRDENSPEKIPVPQKNFSVTVIDQAGVTTKVSIFSIEGTTYLSGKMGEGNYSIPFDNLQAVEFRYVGEKLEATAVLLKGEPVTLQLNQNQNCFGRTDFGSYMIKLGDIRKLIIEGRLIPDK